jgi:hypothetical protein
MSGDRESGFALITVLWLIASLSVVVGLSMAVTRIGNQTTTNRLMLSRGRWAAEACLAIAHARWEQHRLADTMTIDLGRDTRCACAVDDPSSRVDLNSADRAVLEGLGFSETFVIALIDRRGRGPIDDLGEVSELPGFDSTQTDLVTVTGSGAVNLTRASRRVLLALPGLTTEAVDRILYRRAVGRPLESLDALFADLSQSARSSLVDHYSDLVQLTVFAAPQLVVRATGWVGDYGPRVTIEETAIPLPGRLAVAGRRMW